MRLAIVNIVWDSRAATPVATLDRFPALTGWAKAIAHDDPPHVLTVFQRFPRDEDLTRDAIAYRFVRESGPPMPPATYRGARLVPAIASFQPDVVHVNGYDHPLFLRRLRRELPPATAIVVQDHGGIDPSALSTPRKAWMRHGLAAADAVLVATPTLAGVFRASGLVPRSVALRDVMETSTTLTADSRRDRHTPLSILWVGRLNANKDPLTVLEGFARFSARGRIAARLTYIYGTAELERELRRAGATLAGARVRLVGAVPHEALGAHYAAADLFVLGSRFEGSGYAALEAMACGVVPVLTDIPSFRSMTDDGRIGALWRVGDPDSLADALARATAAPIVPQREACRESFERRFSWETIARRATSIYRDLARGRSTTASRPA